MFEELSIRLENLKCIRAILLFKTRFEKPIFSSNSTKHETNDPTQYQNRSTFGVLNFTHLPDWVSFQCLSNVTHAATASKRFRWTICMRKLNSQIWSSPRNDPIHNIMSTKPILHRSEELYSSKCNTKTPIEHCRPGKFRYWHRKRMGVLINSEKKT